MGGFIFKVFYAVPAARQKNGPYAFGAIGARVVQESDYGVIVRGRTFEPDMFNWAYKRSSFTDHGRAAVVGIGIASPPVRYL